MGPTRGVWFAWGIALLGGLAVLTAAILLLADACASGGTCSPTSLTLVRFLTVGGAALAVVGLVSATVLTVRNMRRAAG